MTIEELEKEINSIKERNKRVESDKAWEMSWMRKIVIVLLTYAGISFFLLISNFADPFKTAIVPSVAFILSTLTIPIFKNLWKKYIYKG